MGASIEDLIVSIEDLSNSFSALGHSGRVELSTRIGGEAALGSNLVAVTPSGIIIKLPGEGDVCPTCGRRRT